MSEDECENGECEECTSLLMIFSIIHSCITLILLLTMIHASYKFITNKNNDKTISNCTNWCMICFLICSILSNSSFTLYAVGSDCYNIMNIYPIIELSFSVFYLAQGKHHVSILTFRCIHICHSRFTEYSINNPIQHYITNNIP